MNQYQNISNLLRQLEAENKELKELKEIMPELFDGLILLENSTQIWLECNRHNRNKSERITELFERFKQLIPWKNNKKLGASNER